MQDLVEGGLERFGFLTYLRIGYRECLDIYKDRLSAGLKSRPDTKPNPIRGFRNGSDVGTLAGCRGDGSPHIAIAADDFEERDIE
jgi:hypothetical protein